MTGSMARTKMARHQYSYSLASITDSFISDTMNDRQGLDMTNAESHEAITPPPSSMIEDTLKMIHGQVTMVKIE